MINKRQSYHVSSNQTNCPKWLNCGQHSQKVSINLSYALMQTDSVGGTTSTAVESLTEDQLVQTTKQATAHEERCW